jgi:nucleoside-diphosphate-sugar epimerase
MKSIAVTGATGFIGGKLCEFCEISGHKVIELGRKAGTKTVPWRLGEGLPPHFSQVDVVFHLASATLVESRYLDDAVQSDVGGSRVLIEGVRSIRRSGRRIRFIFLSSQSAKPNAITAYGRSKWAIETMLDQ